MALPVITLPRTPFPEKTLRWDKGDDLPMATIWKSCGTVGEDSTDAGTDIPLEIIDERLHAYRLFYQGENPRPMHPQTKYYTHVVVEVSAAIAEPRSKRLGKPGYYQVVGLGMDDADFLFEPYTFAPFDARAKAKVANLPVDAVVTRDPVTDYMTVDVRFRDAPDRNKVAHSKIVQSAENNEQFVDRVVGEFLTKNALALHA
jgi:hypothetical protein